MKNPIMADSEPVEAVRRAVAALNAGDVPGYIAHFRDDCPRWAAGFEEPAPLSLIEESSRMLLSALEGFRLEEVGLFGTGAYVSAHWRMHGRHVGEFMGMPPTRREVSIENIEVYQFESSTGGLVTSVWTFGDPADFVTQFGAGPTES